MNSSIVLSCRVPEVPNPPFRKPSFTSASICPFGPKWQCFCQYNPIPAPSFCRGGWLTPRLIMDNLLMEWLFSHTLGVLSRTNFLVLPTWTGWGLPKSSSSAFCFLNLPFHFSLSSCILWEAVRRSQVNTFNTLIRNLLSSISKFVACEFYVSQNTRQNTIQLGPLPLTTGITFPPVSDGMVLTYGRALTRILLMAIFLPTVPAGNLGCF